MIAGSKRPRVVPLQRIKARSIEVLVAVNNEALRHKMVEHLRENGYEPIEAVDQVSAVTCLRQRDCDAVILDITDLAETTATDPVVHEISRREPKPGVVFVTPGSSPPEHLEAVGLWRVAYFENARNVNELSQCIATLLEHRATL